MIYILLELYNSTIDLIEGMKQRDILIKEFDALSGSVVAFKSVKFFKKLSKEDLLKVMELEKRNAQLKLNVSKKRDFFNCLVYGKILSAQLQCNVSKKRNFLIVFDWIMHWTRTKVHESLKHTTKEHVFLENPPSSSGTLSSMKNIDDAFTYGDQFLNDKPTEEELGKANVKTEVESMVTVPIHQASSSVPPLSTPVIDLTPPKPISPPVQEPVFTTTTTTLIPQPPPLQQQSTTDPELANRVSALEEICANLAKKNKLQDQTAQALSSRIFTLENHNLYLKIDNYINKAVKEAVQNALQVLVRERFRELSEFEMKEILRDRMFESGSYKSQPEHVALYVVLEASTDRENREKFIEATTKSRKRRRDDQDPPPPPLKDSDQNKKKRHYSDTFSSKQSQAQTSSAWKTSDTRKAPFSSSKQ
ncbi:hypothetical protein Tco_0537583 [Tanacetum coccineum]